MELIAMIVELFTEDMLAVISRMIMVVMTSITVIVSFFPPPVCEIRR